MTEADLLRAILAYLRYRGVLHARTNAGRAGGVRLAPRGWCDITGCYKGRFLAVELKSDDGELSEEQVAFLLRVRDEGGIAVAARSVEDVRWALAAEDGRT